MKRLIVTLVLALGLRAVAQETQCPGGTTYTWLGEDERWGFPDNWSPAQVPGSDDIAYIPSVDLQTQKFPEISSANVTICALQMAKTGTSDPTLTIKKVQNVMRILYIGGRNGLDIGANCNLVLEKQTMLTLLEPGTVKLDGKITFGGENVNEKAYITIPPGATMLTGSGSIVGKVGNHSSYFYPGVGYILGPPLSREAVLVVGKNNALYGDMVIDVALINNGVIDPNAQESPTYGRRMYLRCAGKIGTGDWNVTGGASGGEGNANRNKLILEVDAASSGDILIGNYGTLVVNRHFTVSGTMTVEGNGEFQVDRNFLFDVHRLVQNCAYSGDPFP